MQNVENVNQSLIGRIQNAPKAQKAEKMPNSIIKEGGKPATKSTPEFLTFGGVKFNSSDVVYFKESPISLPQWRADSKNGKDNYKDAIKYEVTLKDGTKMTWNSEFLGFDHTNANKAEVVIENDGTVNFKGLNGVEITDTPNNDKYRLLGCGYTHIEAARSKEKSLGLLDKAFGKKPEYEGTDKDTITIANRILPDGKLQISRGNYVSANEGDKINNIIVDSVVAKNNGDEFITEENLK